MSQRRFDVVFLDAGGVLVHPRRERVVAHLASAGIEVDPGLLIEAHYRGVLAIDTNQASPEDFTHYRAAFATHLGLEGAPHALAVDLLDTIFAPGTGLWDEALPGAREGLAAIAETGIPVVIVSNADGTVAELLASSGLLQVGPGPGIEVAAVVDSGAVGVAKPDPRIFEYALEMIDVTADRAVHVGDAYQYDVRGARAAGVHPVLVDPFDLRPEVDCDRVHGLAEVAALLG